jgi:hypothetical protein
VRHLVRSAGLTLAVALALAGEAAAATAPPACDVPAGTGAVDQYCEELPSADGMGEQTDGALPALPLERLLTERVADQLAEAGPLGRALLGLPAPRQFEPDGGGPGWPAGDAAGLVGPGALARPEGGPVGAVVRSVEASAFDGGFRWVLSASTIGLFAAAWLRLRRRHAY